MLRCVYPILNDLLGREAVHALGVTLLRHFGTTPAVSQGLIFQQGQIARAVELGLSRG